MNQHRPFGPAQNVKFATRPLCPHCGKPMVIRHSSKPKTMIDLKFNFQIIISYYQCNKIGCLGKEIAYLRPKNPYSPLKSDYTFLVFAKICQFRWQKHMTYDEIRLEMKSEYDIIISLTTVENALKIYEIGCSLKYLPDYIKTIKENGGIILTIDGMAPMKGNKSLYVVYDYYSGLTLGAKRLSNQKADTIEEFLDEIKLKIHSQLGVPVVGIISDALPSQRIAIERSFPDIPHCLCHFHFYKLILINATNQDSQITTQIRKTLRNLYDLKQYKSQSLELRPEHPFTALLTSVLDTLQALSNWKRHPKDPCFSGLVLYQRVKDVYTKINRLVESMKGILDEDLPGKIVCRVHLALSEIITLHEENATELEIIQQYLEDLSEILNNLESSFGIGLLALRKFRTKLRRNRLSEKCGPIEKEFIEELMKYVRTKGEMLLNFKRVQGAPTTNNFHELKFKQLKHFLRRVIGFASAKRYLLSHGERIVFIRMDESLQSITTILQNTNYLQARKTIAEERNSRDGLPNIIHYISKWEDKMQEIEQILQDLGVPLVVKN